MLSQALHVTDCLINCWPHRRTPLHCSFQLFIRFTVLISYIFFHVQSSEVRTDNLMNLSSKSLAFHHSMTVLWQLCQTLSFPAACLCTLSIGKWRVTSTSRLFSSNMAVNKLWLVVIEAKEASNLREICNVCFSKCRWCSRSKYLRLLEPAVRRFGTVVVRLRNWRESDALLYAALESCCFLHTCHHDTLYDKLNYFIENVCFSVMLKLCSTYSLHQIY